MGIVEGEPDHTGLGRMARALQRLLLRGQSGGGTTDHWGPKRDGKASTPEPPDRNETSGTEH
jgi:hypothetical protein